MKICIEYLRTYLQSLLKGSISETDLSRFIQLSRSIVQSYLGYIRASITNLCLQQGLTLTDLAYDCIAEAFARDEERRFPLLENFRNSLNTDLETIPENELFLAYKSFLKRIADAQLARLYAQSDPNGAKIHRNIRDSLKQSIHFCLNKDFRGYVVSPKGVDPLDHLETFSIEELEREFLSCAKPHHSTPEMLGILHTILGAQTSYRRSLPLTDVVQLFKKVYQFDYAQLKHVDHEFSIDGLSEFEIDRMRSQVELALKEKILLTYLARGKVDRKQAEAMFCAMQDMLVDWCEMKDAETSLLHYIRQHVDITEDVYETQYRAKMEYLLKIAREEFAARLMRDV
ncbi:MAG: hypothetical protein HY707_05010 [Ignavibacteriae bacterium]|nr:hypothetical protein [Ignavibacteriota bacterium]